MGSGYWAGDASVSDSGAVGAVCLVLQRDGLFCVVDVFVRLMSTPLILLKCDYIS